MCPAGSQLLCGGGEWPHHADTVACCQHETGMDEHAATVSARRYQALQEVPAFFGILLLLDDDYLGLFAMHLLDCTCSISILIQNNKPVMHV